MTWLGWGFIGATTAGGAYEGYKSNLAMRWTGWERKAEKQTYGNAALGALSGLASGFLLTLIVGGDAPEVTSDNEAKWLDRLDDRMILIPGDTLHPGLPLSSILAISRNADASFVIHSIDDARFYLTVFPNSPYRDQILSAFVSSSKHESLLTLASAVHGLPAESQAIERYIGGIATFDEAIGVAGRFTAQRPAVERRAANLANNLNDLEVYTSAFPGSSFTEGIAVRVRDGLKRDQIPEFIEMFPTVGDREELKRRYVISSATTLEAIAALHRYPELRPEADRRAAALARSDDDYRAYLTAFPNGAATAEMKNNLNAEYQAPDDESETPEAGE